MISLSGFQIRGLNRFHVHKISMIQRIHGFVKLVKICSLNIGHSLQIVTYLFSYMHHHRLCIHMYKYKELLRGSNKIVRCQNKSVSRIMMHLKDITSISYPSSYFQKYPIVVQTFRTNTPTPPPHFGIHCVPQKLHVHFQQSSYICLYLEVPTTSVI